MSKEFSPRKLVGSALIAATLASCGDYRPVSVPKPINDIPTLQEKAEAENCETQRLSEGYYQWNWNKQDCFPVPAIRITCDKLCTESELAVLNDIFTKSYKRVAEKFGMEPFENTQFRRQLEVRINDGKYIFMIKATGWAGWAYFDQGGTDHEMTHAFDQVLLGTPRWFAEGLAEYISHPYDPKNDIIADSVRKIGELKKDPLIFWDKYPCSRDAHNVGALFFAELINRGLTYESNKTALKNMRDIGKPRALYDTITASYEAALKLQKGDLDYLISLLSPGIIHNNYVRNCSNPSHVSH